MSQIINFGNFSGQQFYQNKNDTKKRKKVVGVYNK